jgi:hypothetical protein
MQHIHAGNTESVERHSLHGPTAVLQIFYDETLTVDIQDRANVVDHFALYQSDILKPENIEKVWNFLDRTRSVPYILIQDQNGAVYSHAVMAAAVRYGGANDISVRCRGSYDREYYFKLLAAKNVPAPAEPLVTVVVSTYGDPDHLRAFMLAMKFQRYTNWEVIVVTDGPNPNAAAVVEEELKRGRRISIIQTPERRGHWGFFWRHLGVDAAKGEYISLQNDDNYPTPGYLEQMVLAMQSYNARIVMCDCIHSYVGWSVLPECEDISCVMMATSLAKGRNWAEVQTQRQSNITGQPNDFNQRINGPTCGFLREDVWISLSHFLNEPVARIARPLSVHN